MKKIVSFISFFKFDRKSVFCLGAWFDVYKEIDVFVEENGIIHPLEIKKSANPDRRKIKKYELLDKAKLERSNGGIVCMCEAVIPIDDMNCFIPCNLI